MPDSAAHTHNENGWKCKKFQVNAPDGGCKFVFRSFIRCGNQDIVWEKQECIEPLTEDNVLEGLKVLEDGQPAGLMTYLFTERDP